MKKKQKEVIDTRRWVKDTRTNLLKVSFPNKEMAWEHATKLNMELGFVRFVVNHVESDWTKM